MKRALTWIASIIGIAIAAFVAGYFGYLGDRAGRASEVTAANIAREAMHAAYRLVGAADEKVKPMEFDPEAFCVAQRAFDYTSAERRLLSARSELKRCRAEHDAHAGIFSRPVDEYCATPQRAANGANQELRSIKDRLCAPTATGSLPK
jgi:hypothetical protein